METVTKKINGIVLASLWSGGFRSLQSEIDTINNLNVFPIPDGDTGTNMTKTLGGGFNAAPCEHAGEYMRAFAKNTLMSARGNSGVILSQFVRGFAKAIKEVEVLTPVDFCKALEGGCEYAYNAVLSPVEGTMLTVIREASEEISAKINKVQSFEELFFRLVTAAKHSLEKTPEKLDVLKEADVVDSGGAGMLCIFKGMQAVLLDEEVHGLEGEVIHHNRDTAFDASAFGPDFVFEYGYCTEFILQLLNAKCTPENFRLNELVGRLEEIGTSIVAAQDMDIVKVHVHTFSPDMALAIAREYGELLTIKIENMSVQHHEDDHREEPKEKVKYAVCAVCAGDGVRAFFKEAGAARIIDGGQTQNPSAEDMIKAFKNINAEHIIILPNNGNVVLTAHQAAKMYKDADVRVIETKSIAEGYSALSMMDMDSPDIDSFIVAMSQRLESVTTGYVTTATRDARMNGMDIKKDQIIGLDGDNILCTADNIIDAAMGLLASLEDIENKEVLTIFCNPQITEDDKAELYDRVCESYPLMECGFIDGGPEVYYLIMSIE